MKLSMHTVLEYQLSDPLSSITPLPNKITDMQMQAKHKTNVVIPDDLSNDPGTYEIVHVCAVCAQPYASAQQQPASIPIANPIHDISTWDWLLMD